MPLQQKSTHVLARIRAQDFLEGLADVADDAFFLTRETYLELTVGRCAGEMDSTMALPANI